MGKALARPGRRDPDPHPQPRHPHVGDRDADGFRAIDLANLYDLWRRGTKERKPLAEGTVRRMHDIIHSAFEWAMRHELVPWAHNPADRIDKPQKPKARPTAPESNLIARFIAAAPLMLRVYLRLYALAGSRRGQLCALRWDRIDYDASAILWDSAIAVVRGGVAVKSTKTDVEWRVAIDAVATGMLKQLHLEAKELALAVGERLAPDAFVFTCRGDPIGAQPWHPSGASRRVARHRKAFAGNHPDEAEAINAIKAKDLRNYMVTEMLGAGEDPQGRRATRRLVRDHDPAQHLRRLPARS